MTTDRKVFTVLMGGLLLLVLVGAGSIVAVRYFEQAEEVRSRTYQVSGALNKLLFQLREAESSHRGFLLTGDPAYLRPFQVQITEVPKTLHRLTELTLSAKVRGLLNQIQDPIQLKVTEMEQVLELERTEGREAAMQLVSTNSGRELMQEILAVADKIELQQQVLLEQRSERARLMQMMVILMIFAAVALAVLLKAFALAVIRKDIRERRIAGLEMASLNRLLQEQVERLNHRTEEAAVLRTMSNVMQACQSYEEAAIAIRQYGFQLFQNSTGYVYTYNSSRDLAEEIAHWGSCSETEAVFSPQDCWALRLGYDYFVEDGNGALRCNHAASGPGYSMCIPMLAQGDAVGLLYLRYPQTTLLKGSLEASKELAGLVADQIASALVALKLRHTLEQKSIRDPLTGLFNRRYLEENLVREMKRAERHDTQVAVMMADLDHFKQLNDTYGHEAGDAVLAAVGQTLLANTRSEDFCCRYGGEELAVVMPDIDFQAAAIRAEGLLQKVRQLTVQHNSSVLKISASVGLAIYPEHGSTSAQVMKAADLALYQAKKQGRDRVVLA